MRGNFLFIFCINAISQSLVSLNPFEQWMITALSAPSLVSELFESSISKLETGNLLWLYQVMLAGAATTADAI